MAASNNSFLFQDVCIFTGDLFIDRGYVLVLDGKIVDFGQDECLCTPEGTPVLSKPGSTVLPGLIDAHIHALGGNQLSIEQSLRFGVTTVCDMHCERHHILALKELARKDKSKYADYKAAGVGATIKGGWPEPVVLLHGRNPRSEAMINSWPKLSKPADVEPFVQEQIIGCGASHIKMFHELGDCLNNMPLPRPPMDVQKAVVDAAHAHGVIAVGHAFSFLGAMDLLTCGVDGLTHMFMDKPQSDEYIRLLLRNKAYLNPTLSTCASQTREGDEMQTSFAADPLAQRMLFDKAPRQMLGLGGSNASIDNVFASTKAVYEAGVPIIVGSDASGQARGTAYGLGVHIEMHLLAHKIGMSPIEVLKAATSSTADRFGFHDRGRIGPGKKADLVLVQGDVRQVLADPNNLCLPLSGVWRDGILASAWASQGVA